MKNYTVQSGDTLFGIAAREYGDGDLYPVIARMNNLTNPDLIVVGQELLIPYVTYRHLWTTDDNTAARAAITQHYYGTQDTKIQLIWEVASGVAQHAIEKGAWLLIPDLADVGHHTVVDGETFAGLAAEWYGDDHLDIVIAHANEMDPDTVPTPGSDRAHEPRPVEEEGAEVRQGVRESDRQGYLSTDPSSTSATSSTRTAGTSQRRVLGSTTSERTRPAAVG